MLAGESSQPNFWFKRILLIKMMVDICSSILSNGVQFLSLFHVLVMERVSARVETDLPSPEVVQSLSSTVMQGCLRS